MLVFITDELDDFDLEIPLTKTIMDIMEELIRDSNTSLRRESISRALLLLIGNYVEQVIEKNAKESLDLNRFIGKLPESINTNVVSLTMEEMVIACMEVFPGKYSTRRIR